jgi:NADH-quinone oxidoreductase subunit N
MNLGAFLAVDGIERQMGTDELDSFTGLGWHLPLSGAVLTVSLLSLAGFPPLGGFLGKAMLLGAALGRGWTWLAVLMGTNVTLSLYYYVRVFEPLYLRPIPERSLNKEPPALRWSLIGLALGTLLTGIVPEFWVTWASRAATLLSAGTTQPFLLSFA